MAGPRTSCSTSSPSNSRAAAWLTTGQPCCSHSESSCWHWPWPPRRALTGQEKGVSEDPCATECSDLTTPIAPRAALAHGSPSKRGSENHELRRTPRSERPKLSGSQELARRRRCHQSGCRESAHADRLDPPNGAGGNRRPPSKVEPHRLKIYLRS